MSHASLDRRSTARHVRVPHQSSVQLVPVAPPPGNAMRRLRRIGYAVLGLQLIGFCAWSTLLYHRFALTWDYAVYHQPWYLIAHGNLDPRTSVETMPFWRNDAEFAIWPLAPFYWIWPHEVVLQWLQNLGVAGAEMVAFGWMCDLAARWRVKDAPWLAGTGLLLLLLSPWIWWSISFDFHMESVAVLFAALLARDLMNGRGRMWLWVAPVLSAGAPSAVYVLGIGVGAALCGRRYWKRGAILAALAMSYSVFIVLIHADNGAPLARHYGYLAIGVAASYAHGRLASGARLTTGQMARGILTHPLRVAVALWQKRTDVAAALLPSGLAGIAFRPLMPVTLLALLSAILSAGFRFAQPSFQLLPVYLLVPVGTVAVLAWLARRWRRTTLTLCAVLVAQAIGWSAVWGPELPVHWLRVTPAAAAELAKVKSQIPESAEVVVSQGVLGPFSGRVDVHALADSARTLVNRKDIWFVITPTVGTELQTTASSMALIAELAGPLHATIMAHSDGVWAFRWHPPAGLHWLTIPDGSRGLPGWTATGSSGRAVLRGPHRKWHAASVGQPGYVADQIEWLEPAGRYLATVRLSCRGPVNVEVWNDNGNRLLARRIIEATSGPATISLPVDATVAYHESVYSGWGPFRAAFVPPLPGQRLEIRIWSQAGRRVNVYRTSLTPVGSGGR